MKFQFKIQPFQTEAAETVVRVFAGEPNTGASRYRRNIGAEKELGEDERLKHSDFMARSYDRVFEEEYLRATNDRALKIRGDAVRNEDVAIGAQVLLAQLCDAAIRVV